MGLMSFIIGTLALMFAGQFITAPITRQLWQSGRGFGSPNDTYRVVDGCVMGALGLALGFFFRAPFIGIVLGGQGWVGMIALIVGSLIGSHL